MVEATTLLDKTVAMVTHWFHESMTCRLIVPHIACSDRGSEFKGRFWKYFLSVGVIYAVISTAYPRTNGIVEKYNAYFKVGLRHLLTTTEQRAGGTY